MVKDKKEERFAESSIATQTAPVIIDNTKDADSPDRVLTTESALAKILNELEVIKKAITE